MPINQITHTQSALEDRLIQQISNKFDWSKLNPNQPINLPLDDCIEYIKRVTWRFSNKISECVLRAIEAYFINEQAQKVTPDNDEIQLKQARIRLAINKQFDFVYEKFSQIINEYEIKYDITELSQISARDVDNLICFECDVDGIEEIQAVEDFHQLQDDTTILSELYNPKIHGNISKTSYTDFQYFWVREPTKEFSTQKTLRKIPARVFGHFVGKYNTGDKVKILGFYRVVESDDKVKNVEIEVINIEKLETDTKTTLQKEDVENFKTLAHTDSKKFIDDLCFSAAPHIAGNDLAKLAIILAEIGPTSILKKYRSQIHILLEADPGTAKSELLKWFAKISYRGVYADAPSASTRGLTYGQDEYKKRKILKPGLMVTHRRLYLDELDKMPKSMGDLNTAMEQQTAIYNKVPFDVTTKIDCSIIAAANPKFGKWKNGLSLLDQFDPLPTELLSRFLIIRIIPNQNSDKRLKHIFDVMEGNKNVSAIFSQDQISGLINHCATLNPIIPEDIKNKIIDYAKSFSNIEQDEEININFDDVRAQLNVIRIVTAFAKLLQKDIVDEQCTQLAIQFINNCNESLGVRTEAPIIQTDLDGRAASRDLAFIQIVKGLQAEAADGLFSEYELIEEMVKVDRYWANADVATAYWKRRHPDNPDSSFFQPKTGKFKRI